MTIRAFRQYSTKTIITRQKSAPVMIFFYKKLCYLLFVAQQNALNKRSLENGKNQNLFSRQFRR